MVSGAKYFSLKSRARHPVGLVKGMIDCAAIWDKMNWCLVSDKIATRLKHYSFYGLHIPLTCYCEGKHITILSFTLTETDNHSIQNGLCSIGFVYTYIVSFGIMDGDKTRDFIKMAYIRTMLYALIAFVRENYQSPIIRSFNGFLVVSLNQQSS